jgi:hypothetical protein
MGRNPLRYKNKIVPTESAMIAPQIPFIKYPTIMKAMAERNVKAHPFTESKLKSDITSLPSKKAYSNIISLLSHLERGFLVKLFFPDSFGVPMSARS